MKADRIVFTLAAAASCALLSGLPASAQQDTANGTTAQQGTTKDTAKDTAKGTLEEIVVTAQKREQNIQDVPSSIVALSGKEILNQGSVDIQSMSQTMPNLFIRHNLTGDQLLMRGIGTGVDNEGFEQAVAQFVDGVYYGRATLDQNEVFDVERMEVVRG
ncbi:MAG TPA: TonB-dependent receptor plug domain-containing protein, partial [Terriglobales bacterium]|nr:TonB-dependent receptor plug domain-containing protein [Terriglobales bacterium]